MNEGLSLTLPLLKTVFESGDFRTLKRRHNKIHGPKYNIFNTMYVI